MADEEVTEEQEAEVIVTRQEVEIEEAPVVDEKAQALAPPKYEVRPGLGEKFQAENVRHIILTSMHEQLMGRQYRADQAPRWTKVIANGVRQRVQDLDMKRYKIIVYTTILESRGAGVKCAQRCMWDPETDDFIGDHYRNDSIYCYTIVYGVYMY